jgi:hypothetical protein
MMTEQLANHNNVAGLDTQINGDGQCEDRLGCARGILAGVILQVIVISAGAMCWCLYWHLR